MNKKDTLELLRDLASLAYSMASSESTREAIICFRESAKIMLLEINEREFKLYMRSKQK